jgi:hypothetical protein
MDSSTRRRRRRISIASHLFGAFFLVTPLLPAIEEIPVPVPGSELLEAAEAAVFSGPIGDNESRVLGLVEQARSTFGSISDETESAYWLARAALIEGMLFNQMEEDRRAVRALENGLELAERALSAGDFSDGLRVRSDLHSQMMLARGVFYMMRNGEEARDSALVAMDRASDNVRAHISSAGYYLNAPAVAGGDPSQAERLIRRALSLHPTRNERFILSVMLARACATLDDEPGARRALANADELFPGSPWVATVRDELGLE